MFSHLVGARYLQFPLSILTLLIFQFLFASNTAADTRQPRFQARHHIALIWQPPLKSLPAPAPYATVYMGEAQSPWLSFPPLCGSVEWFSTCLTCQDSGALDPALCGPSLCGCCLLSLISCTHSAHYILGVYRFTHLVCRFICTSHISLWFHVHRINGVVASD